MGPAGIILPVIDLYQVALEGLRKIFWEKPEL